MKNIDKKGILIIMSNANGWRNPRVYGGAEFKTSSIINKLTDFDWYILLSNQLFNLFKSKFFSPHLHYFPINTLFKQTDILKDIIQGFIHTLRCVAMGWRLRDKYSLIYSSTTNFSDILPAKLIAIITHKPYIVKYHISIYDEPKVLRIYQNFREEKNTVSDSFIRAILAKRTLTFLKMAKINIVVCNYLGEQLIKCGIKKETIKLNYNGLDFDEMQIYKDENIKKKYDLCFIGRIEKNKGILDIVKVVDGLKNEKPDISAVIIGDGVYLQDIKRIINDWGLDTHILVTGFLGLERYTYLQQSRIFVSPTYAKEGFGLTLLESLFFNVPIVAYFHPVFEEIFGSYSTVKLIKPDIALLKDALIDLLNSEVSREKFDISKYDLTQCVERERKIISEII